MTRKTLWWIYQLVTQFRRRTALAAPCTTLHVSVLLVADGWPRKRCGMWLFDKTGLVSDFDGVQWACRWQHLDKYPTLKTTRVRLP